MKYGKRIVKGGTELFVLTAVATAIGYGTRLLLARTLSTEQFGLIYSALAFMTFFFALKDLGYSSALGKYIPEWLVRKRNDTINSAAWFGITFQALLGIAIASTLFFSADFLAAEFFKNAGAKAVIQVLAIELLIVVTFLRYMFLGFQKIIPYGSFDLLRNALVLVFVLPLLGMGALGVAISYLFASLCVQAVLYYYVFRKLLAAFRPVLSFGREERAALAFGLISFATILTGYVASYADTLLLTGLKTLVDVGLYQAALPTAQLLWTLTTPVVIVMFPALSEMWALGQKETVSNGVRFALKIILIATIGPVMIVATWPELILSSLFGRPFVSAAGALQILAFGTLFYNVMLVNVTTLSAVGRPGANTKTYIAFAVSNLTLNAVLIPAFGITGASLASLLSLAVAFAVAALYVRKYVGVSAPWLGIGKAVAAGFITLGAMALVKALLVVNVFIEIAATVLVGFVVYALLLKIFRAVDEKDLADMESMGLPVPRIVAKILVGR